MDHAKFFAAVRGSLFGGRLTTAQVDGLNVIIALPWADDRYLAYALATAYHETAKTMQPVKEYGGTAYHEKLYGVGGQDPARARRMGNTEPGDGAKYCGRGYPQLTWKVNYSKASDVVGDDLVKNPDLAMKPAYAAKIMLTGMTDGWFTGKKLADYFNAKKTDWKNARRIINGLDDADLIAGHAKKFYAAIEAAR